MKSVSQIRCVEARHRAVSFHVVRRALAASVLLACAQAGMAQSLTGGLYGHEAAGAGVTVRVTSAATGFNREVTPDANGRYAVSGLNPGSYQVSLVRDGQPLGSYDVVVNPNRNAAVPELGTPPATAEANASDLAGLQVSATTMATNITPIDVSTPELSTSYNYKLIDALPVDRSPESVARLDSSVRFDQHNTGFVSIGGASPAENRYYYNEFDVTNDKTSLGSTTLPAEAISDTQLITGGASASWTNATGGVLSSTIKQGSNQFRAGYSLYFTPPTSRWLNPRGHNTLNSIGDYYSYTSANNHDGVAQQYLWASGALVKDKLFFFALLGSDPASKSQAYNQTQKQVSSARDKNYLLNLTWNITNSQSLNVLAHRDYAQTFNNYYDLDEDYNPRSVGAYRAWSQTRTDSRFLIGNYHWQINDDLALRLMGGYLGSIVYSPSSGEQDTAFPYVTSYDTATQVQTNIGRNNAAYVYSPSDYWRRGWKGDLTWQLGEHKLVFGGEYYKHSLASTTNSVPAGWFTYYNQANVALLNGSLSPAEGRYVSQYVDLEGGSFQTINKGAYVEDYWQATDRMLLYGALRWDNYIYKDGVGNQFMRLPTTSPRLGFSWDVNGDSTLKIGGSLGKYSIPLPSSFSFGVAEPRTTYTNYYTYTGIDPNTQAPTGLSQIGSTYYYNQGVPTPAQIAATNVKAPYQYEAQLYAQKQLAPEWSGLVQLGWTDLRRVVEDTCYGGGVQAYAQSHGYPGYEQNDTTCWLVNPGEKFTLKRDYDGDGDIEALSIPGAAIGIPRPKHKYYNLKLGLTHASSPAEPYFLNLSYTYAREYGNTNGLIDEERRNAGWIGQTTAFNYPAVMVGSNGNLAGDIRHSFTATGTYDFANGLSLGGVFTAHSGAPTSCLGTVPDAADPAYPLGAATHYCDGVVDRQGSDRRLPFFWQLDLSATYHWSINAANDLSLQLRMQNVTNRQGTIDINQGYDTGSLTDGATTQSVNYHAATWQLPRTTSMVLRYTFQ
ncbi:carboxypeptidase regulatory-like domain-containing protein [Luteibacter sp. Lutesp34]|uniref:TonB-dependent receptor n=1 Tax=Luteibacter sp. Lutesp34 TaxID=3243030 RepID=UPI0039B40B19